MKLKILFLILISQLSIYLSCMAHQKDWKTLPGIQVYHFRAGSHFLYSSWELENNQIKGKLSLFMTGNAMIPEEGLWVSVGLGSPGMHESDMIVCTYRPNTDLLQGCDDFYAFSHAPGTDVELGGTNDVKFVNGEVDLKLDSNEWKDYKSKIVWNFTKDINPNDKYDWKELSSIMTNQGYIISAYGDNYNNGDIKFHNDFTSGKLIDGYGLPKKPQTEL